MSSTWRFTVCVCTMLLALISTRIHFGAAQPSFGTHYDGQATFTARKMGAKEIAATLWPVVNNKPWSTGIESGVAMNSAQFGGSAACGTCIAVRGCVSGTGSTPIPTQPWRFVLVTDLCSECASGHLDLAQSGDGIWGTEWYPVQCNVGSSTFFYSFQGSNPSYYKLNIANTAVPVKSVALSQPSGPVQMQRSADNYFIATSSSSGGSGFTLPATLTITSALGDTVTDMLPASALSSGSATGQAQFSLSANYDTVPGGGTETVSSSSSSCGAANQTPGFSSLLSPPPTSHAHGQRHIAHAHGHRPSSDAGQLDPFLEEGEGASPPPAALIEDPSPPPTALPKLRPPPLSASVQHASDHRASPTSSRKSTPPTPRHRSSTEARHSAPLDPEQINSLPETDMATSQPDTQSNTETPTVTQAGDLAPPVRQAMRDTTPAALATMPPMTSFGSIFGKRMLMWG